MWERCGSKSWKFKNNFYRRGRNRYTCRNGQECMYLICTYAHQHTRSRILNVYSKNYGDGVHVNILMIFTSKIVKSRIAKGVDIPFHRDKLSEWSLSFFFFFFFFCIFFLFLFFFIFIISVGVDSLPIVTIIDMHRSLLLPIFGQSFIMEENSITYYRSIIFSFCSHFSLSFSLSHAYTNTFFHSPSSIHDYLTFIRFLSGLLSLIGAIVKLYGVILISCTTGLGGLKVLLDSNFRL